MISLNFILAHVVHCVIIVVLAATLPLYTVSIENPVADAGCQATSRYHVSCGLFQGRAVNYQGDTVCIGSCTEVFQKVNTGECEPLDLQANPCTAWFGVNENIVSFTDQTTAFGITIIMLSGAVGVASVAGAFVNPSSAAAWISVSAFMNLIAAALGAGFIYAIANIVDLAELKISASAGQSVSLGVPTPLLAMMPVVELLLLQGLLVFKSDKL